MNVITTAVESVLILEPKVFGDARGFFMESFNQASFDKTVGHDVVFVQDNHSRSGKGVLRGLHYKLPPHALGKLVRVTQGSFYDAALDMRRGSATFGHRVGVALTAKTIGDCGCLPGWPTVFWSRARAPTFCTRQPTYYAPQAEASVLWSDPALRIDWPETGIAPLLWQKYLAAPRFGNTATFG